MPRTAGANAASDSSPAPARGITPAQRRANRRMGLLLVSGIALVFVIATVVIVNTRSYRGLRPLTELPTLGYLPDDTNVVVAIDPTVAEKSEEGREMLDRLGFANGGSFDLEQYTGLARDQIHDAILGLRVDTNVVPQIRLVIRTRSDYDPGKLREKLGATRSRTEGAKAIDFIRPPGIPMEVVLWCASPRTMVICRTVEDMAKVPDSPRPDGSHLAPPMVDLLNNRSDRDSFFWLVAHSDNWDKTLLPVLLARLPVADRKAILQIQTLGIGLRMDRGAVTSRSRPARVTEEVRLDKRSIAVDLITLSGSVEAVEIRNHFEQKLEKLKLEVKESEIRDRRYSVTLAGTASEWEQAIKALTPVQK